MIYLDNCATTKPRKEVVDLLIDSFVNDFSNPSSLHTFGMETENKLEKARETIAKFININRDELYFTSGGTESNNIFITGAVEKNKNIGKKIITSKLEHSAVSEVFKKYEEKGYEVIYLGSDGYGRVDLSQLKEEMDENVALVSIMHVNNELGSINDIKKACENVKKINYNTIFHSDGVQALGKIKVDIKDLGVDGYSMSGHKIHAIKGIGGLYVKKGLNIEPLILGGNQENGLRSGTENTHGIFAFAKAVEILNNYYGKEDSKKASLKNKVIKFIEKNIGDSFINTPEDSPSSILNVSFLHTRGEVILHYLEQDQIYISTASACSSNKKVQSNLEKLGKSNDLAEGSIRICFSYENTEEEIDFFLEKLKYAVEDIRKITMRKR